MNTQLTEQEIKDINDCLEKDIQENGKHWCRCCSQRYKVETPIDSVCPECLKSNFVEYGVEAKGCAFCQNLGSDSDCDDMGYNQSFWFTCDEMPYQNLVNFPFKNTPKKCIEKGCFLPRESKHWACD